MDTWGSCFEMNVYYLINLVHVLADSGVLAAHGSICLC